MPIEIAFRQRMPVGVARYGRADAVSVPAGGTATNTLSTPSGKLWIIRNILVTSATDITITYVRCDGVDLTPELAAAADFSVSDTEAQYGQLIICRDKIEVGLSSAAATAVDAGQITVYCVEIPASL